MIDFTDFYNWMFRLDPDSVGNSPLNNSFDMMGYGSLYIVQNFGMLCFTLFLPFIYRILAPLLYFIPKKVLTIDHVAMQTDARNWLQYGFWISFLEETYLFLFVCSGLNLRYFF